jgi:hypothetical protein
MTHPNDIEFRRLLIARVEALRLDARMNRADFHHQIGATASYFWRKFVSLSDEEAWPHFSLKGISRICEVFGSGTELLRFDS